MILRVATSVVAALTIIIFIGLSMPAYASPPSQRGSASLLLDGQSGQILFQQNGSVRRYPASTTKLLTALVAVERGDLKQQIRVSKNAINLPYDSSSCYLEVGEEQPLEYLLYGLLLTSGNDCAAAIAEGLSAGQPEQFMTWMNETASRLGATKSHFTNPHGLHDPAHYSTALDLALIARGALANPTVAKIAATQRFYWPGKSEKNDWYYNHNQMLTSYEGSIGGKTGFTEEAGLTLVTAAKRNGRYLIGVVMGHEQRVYQYNDMKTLLDYGFTDFEQIMAIGTNLGMGTIPVREGQTDQVAVIAPDRFPISVLKGKAHNLTLEARLTREITAPVESGQNLGTVTIREGDRLLGVVDLVASETVAATPVFPWPLQESVAGLLKIVLYVAGALFLFRRLVRSLRLGWRRLKRPAKGQTGIVSHNSANIASERQWHSR